MKRLEEMRDKHPSVGEVRGLGMLAAIELVKDKETREPFTPQRMETRNAEMTEVVEGGLGEGLAPGVPLEPGHHRAAADDLGRGAG